VRTWGTRPKEWLLLAITGDDTNVRPQAHAADCVISLAVGYSGGVLKTGILNPAINSLLSRIRHTNTLVIADRGFPYWPQLETVDISLVDDIPRVLDVFEALSRNFVVAQIVMAEEFLSVNSPATKAAFAAALAGVPVLYEPHVTFKKRVPQAIGLIRTGDTISYANLILESG
jgi:D-ribose pyranase